MTLPTERVVFQFDKSHATVIFTNDESAATGRRMPKLYVQVIDAYRYQREFSVQFRHEPGNSKVMFWEVTIYRHPGVRLVHHVTQRVAEGFIDRFLYLCKEWPDRLFNVDDERRARCEGFVHMADSLHAGAELTKRMLS